MARVMHAGIILHHVAIHTLSSIVVSALLQLHMSDPGGGDLLHR